MGLYSSYAMYYGGRGMTSYPRRPQFFAQRFTRSLVKSCACQTIGQDAFALLVTIASTEDAKRYSGPVTFFNGQLAPILGFGKWERLDKARRVAVKAGWLHYAPPPAGAREPGVYWVEIPPDVATIPDGPVDENFDVAVAFYNRGYDDGRANKARQPYPDLGEGNGKAYPEKGEGKSRPSPATGYASGYASGDGSGDGQGEHSYPAPLPIPIRIEAARNEKPETSNAQERSHGAWERIADRLLSKIHAPRKSDKRQLEKIAWLVANGKIVEAFFWEAVDAGAKGKNQIALFRHELNESVGQEKLASLLKSAPKKPPPENRVRASVHRIDESAEDDVIEQRRIAIQQQAAVMEAAAS